MNDYLLNRLRADAAHTLIRAKDEEQLQHKGLRGRFRELLIDSLLAPWLPPYVMCGTGMIIAQDNVYRESTQDDIILYDRSLVPPILASPNHSPQGVYLYNSVIARIEVKSRITKADIYAFVRSSREIANLRISVQPGSMASSRTFEGAYNLLFAFDSDAEGRGNVDYQVRRLIAVMNEEGINPVSGIVSMLCIPGYGFWKVGENAGQRCWQRLESTLKEDHVAWFVGCVSNTCYSAHARRQGRDPSAGLEGGVGMYLPHPFVEI